MVPVFDFAQAEFPSAPHGEPSVHRRARPRHAITADRDQRVAVDVVGIRGAREQRVRLNSATPRRNLVERVAPLLLEIIGILALQHAQKRRRRTGHTHAPQPALGEHDSNAAYRAPFPDLHASCQSADAPGLSEVAARQYQIG